MQQFRNPDVYVPCMSTRLQDLPTAMESSGTEAAVDDTASSLGEIESVAGSGAGEGSALMGKVLGASAADGQDELEGSCPKGMVVCHRCRRQQAQTFFLWFL